MMAMIFYMTVCLVVLTSAVGSDDLTLKAFVATSKVEQQTSGRYLSVALDSSLVREKWGHFQFGDEDDHQSVAVSVDTKEATFETSCHFLSLAVGSSLIKERWRTFDVRSRRLKALIAELSPCYLRLGGTEADFLIFDPTVTVTNWKADGNKWGPIEVQDYYNMMERKDFKNFTMTAADWDGLNSFTQAVGCRLLFDFNVLLRSGSAWNFDNALSLLHYSVQKGYAANLDFELGNEPNAFHHLLNFSLDPHQLGHDFLTMVDLVRHTPELKNLFNASIFVGPDTSGDSKKRTNTFIEQYLSVVKDSVNAVTWHQYYINGRTATIDNFTDPGILDTFQEEVNIVRHTVAQTPAARAKLWLGETGSAYGGGAKDLSDAYVAGFMWMDKLGIAAQNGIDVVIRQTLYGGSYALLDKHLNPLPDYWLSVLYKKLVGTRVLAATSSDTSRHFRVYAHCTNNKKTSYAAGAVTVYAMNLGPVTVNVTFTSPLSKSPVDVFLITPHGKEGLKSKHVNLNGKKLKMMDDTTFPPLTPVILPQGQAVTLPSRTFGFFVFPKVNVTVCWT